MINETKFSSSEGNVELLISEDRFSAYLKINENGIISQNEIIQLLEKAGISETLNLTDLKETKKKYSEPFLIAETLAGKEFKIKYLFDENHCYDQLKTSSLSDFSKLARVTEDVPLAIIELAENGTTEQFLDVFGKPVSVEEVMERFARNYLSEQVYYSRDKGKIFSRVSGYPYITESGAVAIINAFECSENLNKQKIDFYGDLIINGNVDNCQLFVRGDLTIKGNISNCLGSWVMAQGHLEFDSAENSFIGAGKGVSFNKNVRFSYLVSDGMVLGSDNSSFVGGVLRSSEGIHIAVSGSSVPVKTRLEISVLPYQKERLKIITASLNKLKKKNNIELSSLNEKQNRLENDLEKAYTQLISPKKLPVIKVSQKVYKDTWIKIFNQRKGIFKETAGSEFKSEKHGIKINLG